jgi:hypothetical protein
VQKPLACDFIAYAYAPAATCVLLPCPRAAARVAAARPAMDRARAANQGYTSVSVCVPRGVLMQAIVEARFVAFAA